MAFTRNREAAEQWLKKFSVAYGSVFVLEGDTVQLDLLRTFKFSDYSSPDGTQQLGTLVELQRGGRTVCDTDVGVVVDYDGTLYPTAETKATIGYWAEEIRYSFCD